MKDKTTNKVARISVRLTNHLLYMLGLISKECKVKQSTLIRFALDNLITLYELLQNEKLGLIQNKAGEYLEG